MTLGWRRLSGGASPKWGPITVGPNHGTRAADPEADRPFAPDDVRSRYFSAA